MTAKSIRLSSRYQLPDGSYVSTDDLAKISKHIEDREEYEFHDEEIADLLREKQLLDQGLSIYDKVKIVLFLLALSVPAGIGVALFVYL